MTVGYIGLGSMGGALAARLVASAPLVAYDLDDRTRKAFDELGAEIVDSAAEVARRCDTVLLCLPTSKHVHQAIFGEQGLAEGLQPGTLVIDQTTGDPGATRDMARELAVREVTLIDAPVSGGIAGAAAGTIAIMVGADPDHLERARQTLQRISPNIFHAGEVGAGQTIKLVNNLISGAQRLLSLEAVALAAKNGIDPQTAVEILQSGGGRNGYLERSIIPQVIEGRLNVGFTLGLAHKDVRLACQLGLDSGVPMFYGELTKTLLQTYVNENGADAQVDTAAVAIDRVAGTNVVAHHNPAEA